MAEIVENEGRNYVAYTKGFERAHCSEEWVDLADRGGLIHVSDRMYTLSYSMEMELRMHLCASASVGEKEKAVKEFML